MLGTVLPVPTAARRGQTVSTAGGKGTYIFYALNSTVPSGLLQVFSQTTEKAVETVFVAHIMGMFILQQQLVRQQTVRIRTHM